MAKKTKKEKQEKISLGKIISINDNNSLSEKEKNKLYHGLLKNVNKSLTTVGEKPTKTDKKTLKSLFKDKDNSNLSALMGTLFVSKTILTVLFLATGFPGFQIAGGVLTGLSLLTGARQLIDALSNDKESNEHESIYEKFANQKSYKNNTIDKVLKNIQNKLQDKIAKLDDEELSQPAIA